ncbi:MAG: DeoR/GlpR family DNA-binding transcription regulator [Spirochaetaceae bacterium]|nr:DeoR/GlpR family DNA-binding transcription regulator [Spirochaetaceae bacterium]
MIDRHNKILDVLAISHKIEVTALSEILEVSQVTVRKDLDLLEELGLLRREHGYAVFGPGDDACRRMAIQYDVKRRIARSAADLVEDGETVMVESGSCCTLLAEQLAYSKKDITIVTNSAYIAGHIRQAKDIRIVLLGGEYLPGPQITAGPITSRAAEVFLPEKFFVGANGFNEKYGFTGRDHLRAQTVRDLAEQAGEIIVLTESEKFNRKGAEKTIALAQTARLITDDRLGTDREEALRTHDTKIEKVPFSDSSSAALRERLLALTGGGASAPAGFSGEPGALGPEPRPEP